MRIDITKSDIAAGKMGDNVGCPVARAATRVLGVPCCVHGQTLVHSDVARFWVSNDMYGAMYGELPAAEVKRVRRYDRTGVMRPHSFELLID